MKKILLLTGIMILAQTNVMAYLNESEASSLKTLRMQGYSDTMMEIVDYMNYRSKGGKYYVRQYHSKDGNVLGRAYQRLKVYVDPIQDDGSFARHHIEFSNTWLGNDTPYSSEMVKNEQVEDL